MEVGNTIIYDLPGLYIKASKQGVHLGESASGHGSVLANNPTGHCVVVVEHVYKGRIFDG